jgi:hypothetical protein
VETGSSGAARHSQARFLLETLAFGLEADLSTLFSGLEIPFPGNRERQVQGSRQLGWPVRNRALWRNLAFQIIVAMVLGAVVGLLAVAGAFLHGAVPTARRVCHPACCPHPREFLSFSRIRSAARILASSSRRLAGVIERGEGVLTPPL